MLDRSKIGRELEPFSTTIERGRLKLFAKAVGETSPVYTDETAAQAAGYQSIPAPPTYPFVVEMDSAEFLPVLRVLDMDLNRVLHGEQEFEYFSPICEGDKISVKSRIKNIYEKKNGDLEFVVIASDYTNQNDELVATGRNTTVYRNS